MSTEDFHKAAREAQDEIYQEEFDKLHLEIRMLKEILQDLRSEIDEDNEHDPETCGDRGDCLVCMIDRALIR